MNESVAILGHDEGVCGILSEPEPGVPKLDAPVVVFLNAGLTHRVGPRRIHVQIARRLGALGVTSLRFDLPGIGDSQRRSDDLPAREGAQRDIAAAMDHLTEVTGVDRFVLFGICSGADYAFRVGLADPRVVGLILVNGYTYRTRGNYIRHYLRRLINPGRWSNLLSVRHPLWRRLGGAERPRRLVPAGLRLGFYELPEREDADADLRAMLDRGVQVAVVHGKEMKFNHAGQFYRSFPSARNHPGIVLDYVDYADHTFTLVAAQDRLVEFVSGWIERVTAA